MRSLACRSRASIALPGGVSYIPAPEAGVYDKMTTDTFAAVADIIAEVCDIDRGTIRPESHTINDLGIDSLDFLDVTFAIDKRFGIKMPIETWMQDINEGKVSVDDYFILSNLCQRIDELVAAKTAA
jgi:acyl carrier protein